MRIGAMVMGALLCLFFVCLSSACVETSPDIHSDGDLDSSDHEDDLSPEDGDAVDSDIDADNEWGDLTEDGDVDTEAFDSDGALVELTIAIMGEGTVTLDPPGGIYPSGTLVEMIPEPETGFHFSTWLGIGRSDNPLMLAIEADLSLTAVFLQDRNDETLLLELDAPSAMSSDVTGPPEATTFTVDGPVLLAAISTVHLPDEDIVPEDPDDPVPAWPPLEISLSGPDGFWGGPWKAFSETDPDNPQRVVLSAFPGLLLTAGVYTLHTSRDGRWVFDETSGNRGLARVRVAESRTLDTDEIEWTNDDPSAEGLRVLMPASAKMAEQTQRISVLDGFDYVPDSGYASRLYVFEGVFADAGEMVTLEIPITHDLDLLSQAIVSTATQGTDGTLLDRTLLPVEDLGDRVRVVVSADDLPQPPPARRAGQGGSSGGAWTIMIQTGRTSFENEHFSVVVPNGQDQEKIKRYLNDLEQAYGTLKDGLGLVFVNYPNKKIPAEFTTFEGGYFGYDPDAWGYYDPSFIKRSRDILVFNTGKFSLSDADIQFKATTAHELCHLAQAGYMHPITSDKDNYFKDAICTWLEWEVCGSSFRPDAMAANLAAQVPLNGVFSPTYSATGSIKAHGYNLATFIKWISWAGQERVGDIIKAYVEYPDAFQAVSAVQNAHQFDWQKNFYQYPWELYAGSLYQCPTDYPQNMVILTGLPVWGPADPGPGVKTEKSLGLDLAQMSATPSLTKLTLFTPLPIRGEIRSENSDCTDAAVYLGIVSPQGKLNDLIVAMAANSVRSFDLHPKRGDHGINLIAITANQDHYAACDPGLTLSLTPAHSVSVSCLLSPEGGTVPVWATAYSLNSAYATISQAGLDGAFVYAREDTPSPGLARYVLQGTGTIGETELTVSGSWTMTYSLTSDSDEVSLTTSGSYEFSDDWPGSTISSTEPSGTFSGSGTHRYKDDDGNWQTENASWNGSVSECSLEFGWPQ